jgi:demethylmenaquinone methyltransferase / 2-methoxy-6-polyprenyl-1,4-benzoquinol methylase
MTPEQDPERFAPRASREMARMFDSVTARYALLNSIMTLGQDASWRRAMWSSVPESARAVLDLCTGEGSSLPGLRRPGRLVIGLDVSLGMLHAAAAAEERNTGWVPRLVAGDAFRLPFRDASIDAITIAFGIRNLRPQSAAVDEIARVLRPGGTLVVLEATGPGRGLTAPLHGFWVSHMVPLLGRLSPDPSAYRYLADSVLEFGTGTSFTSALASGFERPVERRFLMGATRLWSVLRSGAGGVQAARVAGLSRGELPRTAAVQGEQRVWSATQGLLSIALAVTLMWVAVILADTRQPLPLAHAQRIGLGILAAGVAVIFVIRGFGSLQKLFGPGPRA